ncbi:hypothetical protein N9B73_05915 [Verrucomicrobiales bacterium]|nr:hypothetical protein [Verrucomicrobiales bacterium]
MRDYTSPNFMDRNASNPFIDDVFIDHPSNLPGVGSVHQNAFFHVLSTLESMVVQQNGSQMLEGSGRTFLITSPRAGYGKTHLVARLKENAGTITNFLTLPFDRSRPVSWPIALSSIVRQLSTQSKDATPSVKAMDEIARFFLSRLIIDQLSNCALKPKDCPENAETLRSDFINLFAADSGSRILNWTAKRSSELAGNASPAFLQQLGIKSRELSFWLRVIIDHTKGEPAAFDALKGLSNGEARERLLQLLRIGVSYRPVLLVADALDGFFGSNSAGMDIAEIVTAIRENVGRSLTLICVNEDVWKSSFKDQLSSAWLDRITGETTRLRNISPETAGELVTARLARAEITGSNAEKFVDSLSNEHLWIDAETTLYPRAVLRQASALWKTQPESFFTAPGESAPAQSDGEDLSQFTDKLDFFKSLQEESLPERSLPVTPAPAAHEPANANGDSDPREPNAPNPFFASNGSGNESDLAGIDSIINDIRGSGKAVVSEIQKQPSEQTPPQVPGFTNAPQQAPAQPSRLHPQITEPPKQNPFTAPASNGNSPSGESKVFTGEGIEATIKRRENELLRGNALRLDLERLGLFVQKMGIHHPALGQHEERFPSSRSTCLRWSVRNQSILLGFESPRNVYFWNNLLQQSLSSNDSQKIVAFSHPSDKFDSGLFSTFGFSPAVIKGRMDVIEMKDRELAMIYAAETAIRETSGTPAHAEALQRGLRYLDPLWRRICEKIS